LLIDEGIGFAIRSHGLGDHVGPWIKAPPFTANEKSTAFSLLVRTFATRL